MLQVTGVNYPAIIVRDMQESIEFYQRLGFVHLYTEPNRDDPESITAMLYAGSNDTFLQLVGPVHPGAVNIAEASPGIGSMQYLSLAVTPDQMQAMFHEMSNAGVRGSEEITRGFERLVFMEDPNGVLITLVAWITEPPAGMPRHQVLERAATIRESEGAPFVEDSHIRRAIEELRSVG